MGGEWKGRKRYKKEEEMITVKQESRGDKEMETNEERKQESRGKKRKETETGEEAEKKVSIETRDESEPQN